MSLLSRVHTRLMRNDLLQLSTLFFVILLFSLIISWPTSQQDPNNSWYAISQARVLLLALLAIGYGSSLSVSSRQEQLTAVLALLSLAFLSAPLEVATFAISFPSTSLSYSLGMSLLDTFALFGLGLVLGRLLGLLRLKVLMPLAIPATLAGLLALDLGIGISIFNPFTASTQYSPYHVISMSLFAIGTLLYLLVPREKETVN